MREDVILKYRGMVGGGEGEVLRSHQGEKRGACRAVAQEGFVGFLQRMEGSPLVFVWILLPRGEFI